MLVCQKSAVAAGTLTEAELKEMAKKFEAKDMVETATLKDIKRDGREIYFDVKGKTHKATISSSQTKLSLGGKELKRKDIKAGMTCATTYPADGMQAKSVACK